MANTKTKYPGVTYREVMGADGKPDKQLHGLRHSFASVLVSSGVDISR